MRKDIHLIIKIEVSVVKDYILKILKALRLKIHLKIALRKSKQKNQPLLLISRKPSNVLCKKIKIISIILRILFSIKPITILTRRSKSAQLIVRIPH